MERKEKLFNGVLALGFLLVMVALSVYYYMYDNTHCYRATVDVAGNSLEIKVRHPGRKSDSVSVISVPKPLGWATKYKATVKEAPGTDVLMVNITPGDINFPIKKWQEYPY